MISETDGNSKPSTNTKTNKQEEAYMNNLTTIPEIENSLIASDENMLLIKDNLKEVNTELFNTSKGKYLLKARMIEECQDMSTKEKLVALDSNYDRHNQEVLRNIIITSIFSLALMGIVKGAPTILKKVS